MGGIVYWPVLCGNSSRHNAFWDDQLTVNTSNPNLTPCFQKSVLVWIPSGIFCLCLPFYALHLTLLPTCSHKDGRRRDISKLYVFKMCACVILVCVAFTQLLMIIVNGLKGKEITLVMSLAAVLKLSSFTFSCLFVHWEFIRNIHASWLFFIYWGLEVVANTPSLKWNIDFAKEEMKNFFVLVAFHIQYVLMVTEFILHLFADVPTYSIDGEYYEYNDMLIGEQDPDERKDAYILRAQPPEDSAAFLSKLSVFWMNPLFAKGYKRNLVFEDLPDIPEQHKCKPILSTFFKSFNSYMPGKVSSVKGRTQPKQKDSKLNCLILVISLAKAAFGPLVVSAIARLMVTVTKYPVLTGLVIEFIGSDDPHKWKGYMLALLFLTINITHSVTHRMYFHNAFALGMRVRTCLNAAVYRKALKMSNAAKQRATVGEIVNLMSVDSEKVQDACVHLHGIWAFFLWLGLSIFLLWRVIGLSCLAGVAVIVIVAPINAFYLGRKYAYMQVEQMQRKDSRLKLITQILNGIQVLKLYAWEPAFIDQTDSARNYEVDKVKEQQPVRTFMLASGTAVPYMVVLAIYTSYVLLSGNVLEPSTAFVTMNLAETLNFSMDFISVATVLLFEACISINRITKFLMEEEIDPRSVHRNPCVDSAVIINDGTFSWGGDSAVVLKNINMSAKRGQLVAVVGRVGCGKSSLISAILGDMKKHRGYVNVDGSVAYVSQQAWIQNCTLKENVLFGRPENSVFYHTVMDACALQSDLNVLPAGDATEIGEKGVNLSGGQKQRVSLARAVYQDCDVYLMDDPLSAVDAQVGKHIFENVIGPNGLLEYKTRILVTHNLSFLPYVDSVLTITDGKISEKGTYDELINHEGPFAEFVKAYMSESGNDLPQEKDTTGFVDDMKYLSSISSDSDISSENESEFAKLLDPADSRQAEHCIINPKLDETVKNKPSKHMLIEDEQATVGSIKFAVIKNYIKAVSVTNAVLAFFFFSLFTGSIIGSNVWLSKWSDDSTRHVTDAKHLTYFRLGVYGVFAACTVLSCFCLAMVIAYGGVKASRYLHYQLIGRIMRAPMAFFESTPIGRITNRCSLDIDRVDNLIPATLRRWTIAAAPVVSALIIVAYSTPLFLSAIIPILGIFITTQRIYTKTARQLRRIDSITRSPIYVHLDETLNGLSSIRAFQEQSQFVDKNENLLDDRMIAWYAVFVGQRWITFYLALLGAFVIFFATIFATLAKDTISPGVAGLSISYSVQAFFAFGDFVRVCADLETLMVSVERIKEYSEIKTEAEWKSTRYSPGTNWPKTGRIKFKDYSARYWPGAELVLKSLNIEVQSSEKIGIVGRTGAGKSSLTSALFRVIEPAAGSIFIDNIDISVMGLHDLRSKLTIIPQNPVLFAGSIRMNLDPLNIHTDAEIWTALDHAHLKRFVCDKKDGLQYQCAEGAEALSVGQKQLMCLARALLRKSKILVLDEATASVDLKTDDLIQSTIRTEFKDCTILTIAHRLNTIMDYDRILVLHEGKVKEFDSPLILLNQEDSLFYKMANNAGLISR